MNVLATERQVWPAATARSRTAKECACAIPAGLLSPQQVEYDPRRFGNPSDSVNPDLALAPQPPEQPGFDHHRMLKTIALTGLAALAQEGASSSYGLGGRGLTSLLNR